VQDEALELVLDAIENYVKTKLVSDPNSKVEPYRRADVLQAILGANSLSNAQLAYNQEQASTILCGTSSINSETESALHKIGIRIKRGGKHPKLIYGKDDRYVLTTASTGSDIKGCRNLVADIKRKYF